LPNDIILNLIEKALAGNIELKEFYEKWPKTGEDNAYLRRAYDDLEDGINHTPGLLFSDGVDQAAWCSSFACRKIYLHQQLLNKDISDGDRLRLTEMFEAASPRGLVEVDGFIANKGRLNDW